MWWLIVLTIIGSIILGILTVVGFAIYDFPVFLALVQLCLPLLALSIAVGAVGLKRKGGKAGAWVIFICLVSQIAALIMLSEERGFAELMRMRYSFNVGREMDIVWATFILASIIFVIPGWVMIRKR